MTSRKDREQMLLKELRRKLPHYESEPDITESVKKNLKLLFTHYA